MAAYALWYFKPQNGNYATFETNVSISDLGDLGFDYMIALHTCGKDCQLGQMPMGGYSYDDGYNDGKGLAQWLEQEVSPGLPYLVEIPVLVKDGKEQWALFENSNYTIKPAVRGLDYWRGWVDGVYTHTGGLQRGFYWNLEFPWQLVREVVYEEDISTLSDKIIDWGQQFIWIPSTHGDISWEHTDIKTLSKYFTYIFAQSNYYQGKTTDLGAWFSSFKNFRDSNHLNNLFMEMECDGRVQTGDEEHNIPPETFIHRACDYVQYAKNYPHRAYYYGTNIKNLIIVKSHCPDYIG